jgi:hypothetical protein
LPLSHEEKREKEDEKNLTALLTFVLSRKGREEMKGKNLKEPSPFPSPAGWRGKMKRKEFNRTPHFYSLPQGERREKREIYLIKSILFVFVNFGVLNV